SSRPSARARGFRLRRMARLHEHWIVGVDSVAACSWRERLATFLHPDVRVRRFATLFAPPDKPCALLERLGVRLPYVVTCAGGGRQDVNGRDSAQLFADVAAQVAATGVCAVAV